MREILHAVEGKVAGPDFNFAIVELVFKVERNRSRKFADQTGRIAQRKDVIIPAALAVGGMGFDDRVRLAVGIDVFP